MEEKQQEDPDFPIGMKVLAIDANIVCLTYLVELLRQCQYQVTSTTQADEAIELLREKKDDFDIVITDVFRLDMDGFKFLNIIGLQMDIPVVLVSANAELEVVKRSVMEGAQAYLPKPVSLQDLKNVWQHVLRKRLEKKSVIKSIEDHIENPTPNSRKRVRDEKDEDGKSRNPVVVVDDDDGGSSSTKKKPRVTWSKELHLKFIQAFDQLKERERVPNTILKVMNVPGLTRENVASHLQKHREGLRKKATESRKHSNGTLDCNDQMNKTQNFTLSRTHSLQYLHSGGKFERATQELHGSEFPRSTAGNLFPVPDFKWFNFPAHKSNLRPCDGFLGYTSDAVLNNVGPRPPYYLHPFGNTNHLNPTSQTFGNSTIEIGAIPQEETLAWSNPSINNTAECSFHQQISCSMEDDELTQILKQFLD